MFLKVIQILLALYFSVTSIAGYVVTCAVTENPMIKQHVILYGDSHEHQTTLIQEKIEQHQTPLILAKIAKALAQSSNVNKTIFLYEGPCADACERADPAGAFLIHLKEFHTSLNEKLDHGSLINLENRNFLLSDLYIYLQVKEILVTLPEENKTPFFELLEKPEFDCFRNKEDKELYLSLYHDVLNVILPLSESLQALGNLSTRKFFEQHIQKLTNSFEEWLKKPHTQTLQCMTAGLFDLQALVHILSNQEVDKYIIFAGTSHCQGITYLLEKALGFKTVYSSTNEDKSISSNTIDLTKYCAAKSKEYYIHYDLPTNKDFNHIDKETLIFDSSEASFWQLPIDYPENDYDLSCKILRALTHCARRSNSKIV